MRQLAGFTSQRRKKETTMEIEKTDTQVKERENNPSQAAEADDATMATRLSRIYGGLKGIQDRFTECVKAFRAVQTFDKDLQAVIGRCLPPEVNRVSFDDNGVCDPSLTDEGYAKWLADALKGKTNVQRLNSLCALSRMLREGIKDLRRKETKLTERIRLQGATTTEGRSAALLKGRVDDALNILTKRQFDVADKFYSTRQRILVDLAALTMKIADTCAIDDGRNRGKYAPEVLEALRKHSSTNALAAIQKGDDRVTGASSYKYKYNPLGM